MGFCLQVKPSNYFIKATIIKFPITLSKSKTCTITIVLNYVHYALCVYINDKYTWTNRKSYRVYIDTGYIVEWYSWWFNSWTERMKLPLLSFNATRSMHRPTLCSFPLSKIVQPVITLEWYPTFTSISAKKIKLILSFVLLVSCPTICAYISFSLT
jgi:hypothetical protein